MAKKHLNLLDKYLIHSPTHPLHLEIWVPKSELDSDK